MLMVQTELYDFQVELLVSISRQYQLMLNSKQAKTNQDRKELKQLDYVIAMLEHQLKDN